ncbi:FH1/FH2 domain-containing protein 1-like isoform X2 [Gymnodraco acuticeps]|uniref:FH1/FH2 domain-containing protein 1-like isoform X2 n=1 Tax=Gymnodraco acuticeps TaxID=8218 RepID=A0A6P8T9Q1_GYMAC|nr:FH1/FH2 domain-containing protein 1-like isoform X2 [Gymnodraco acuticeps]
MCVQTLSALPDQDSFYDVTDSLEQLGMESIVSKQLSNREAEPDLKTQFTLYETSLRNEDGDDVSPLPRKERRKMAAGERSRRSSSQTLPPLSSTNSSPSSSPTPPSLLSPTTTLLSPTLSPSSSPTPPTFLSPTTTLLSPTLSSASSNPAGGSRASSPLSSDCSSSGSQRGSPLPPQTDSNGTTHPEEEEKSPSSARSRLFSKASSFSEEAGNSTSPQMNSEQLRTDSKPSSK